MYNTVYHTDLEISCGFEDNSFIHFSILCKENIHCDSSLEPSPQEDSNLGS